MFTQILKAIIGLFQGEMTRLELETILDKREKEGSERLDWRNSTVDLLKLLELDSSPAARAVLWAELGNAEDYTGEAGQNRNMHRQLLMKVAAHGIQVPHGS